MTPPAQTRWPASSTVSHRLHHLPKLRSIAFPPAPIPDAAASIERQGYLESRVDPETGSRLRRLTEAGRLAVVGDRDPETRWSRKWDRKWRLFLFDVAEAKSLLAADPLLPSELLPKGYLGRKVWRRRKAVLAEAARYASELFAR